MLPHQAALRPKRGGGRMSWIWRSSTLATVTEARSGLSRPEPAKAGTLRNWHCRPDFDCESVWGRSLHCTTLNLDSKVLCTWGRHIEDGFPRITEFTPQELMCQIINLYLRVVDSGLQHNRLKSFWLIRRLLNIWVAWKRETNIVTNWLNGRE